MFWYLKNKQSYFQVIVYLLLLINDINKYNEVKFWKLISENAFFCHASGNKTFLSYLGQFTIISLLLLR